MPPEGVSFDTDEEEGDLDFPRAGPWRFGRTRQESRRSLWAGTYTCERSGGWLVEVATYPKLACSLYLTLSLRALRLSLPVKPAFLPLLERLLVCPSEFCFFTRTSSFQTLPFFLSLRHFRLGPFCRPSGFQLSCPHSADIAL